MENPVAYNYTMGEHSDNSSLASPHSDILVINMDDTSPPCDTSPVDSHVTKPLPRVTQPDIHSFSMASLLSDNESETSLHHVTDQPITSNPTFRQMLPSIYETFALYSGTTTDTFDRMFDLTQPRDLQTSTKRVQMVQPVSNNNASSTTDQRHAPRHSVDKPGQHNTKSTTYKKKKDAQNKSEAIEKPPYTYVGLIVMAIDSSEEKMLTLQGVRDKLKTWFQFFNGDYTGWRESVRHTLSSHRCFYKAKQDVVTRIHHWAVNYRNVKPQILVRQNRTRLSGQHYEYNLHEQVGVPPILIPGIDYLPGADKRDGLKLPPKPSFRHNHTNQSENDFLCARTDDVASQVGDYGALDSLTIPTNIYTSEHCTQLYKRKTGSLETLNAEYNETTKRRKTAAVNPTPNTSNPSSQIPKPDTANSVATNQTNMPPTLYTHTPTVHQPTYPTDMYSIEQNYIHNTHLPIGHFSYQSKYWPFNVDYNLYNQTNTFPCSGYHGYQQAFDTYQQYQQQMVPTYPTWPYHTNYAYQDSSAVSADGGYWRRQLSEPCNTPVNLSKNPDKIV